MELPPWLDARGNPARKMSTPEQSQVDQPEEGPEESPAVPPLLGAPRTSFGELITTAEQLEQAVEELASGEGDIALDAERASGYRYSQRAYLIQIHRRKGGLHLIDPIPFIQGDIARVQQAFAPLNAVIQSALVIIHASSQDLPCLREVGLEPRQIFDTEVAARIAGFPRVGLGALTEGLLNLRLAKEHSAVDWSIRPLHHDWLIYAALDVDVLIDLKDEVVRALKERSKLEWAIQESQALLDAPPPVPRKDPWRRTSGIHQIKRPEQLAIIRELWSTRDELARERDVAPGRLVNDRALVNLAIKAPHSLSQLASLPAWKKESARWWSALERARANPTVSKAPALPGPPTHLRIWKDRAPVAYARLTHARARLAEAATTHTLPAENLLAPELVRRFCWEDPPSGGRSEVEVAQFLRAAGARPWQVALTSALLLSIENEREPLIPPPDEPLPQDEGAESGVSDLS